MDAKHTAEYRIDELKHRLALVNNTLRVRTKQCETAEAERDKLRAALNTTQGGDKPEPKPIIVTVEGGCVVDIENVPDGVAVEILDRDETGGDQ